MVQFLEPPYKATLLICGSTYPTINQALPLYILLIKAIRQVSEQYDIAPIEPAAQAMIQKISKYIYPLSSARVLSSVHQYLIQE
ncbi:hypothetical protein O181_101701 [Austropuccinia psidii MF-1]|uniref:Uncharacterized protein n=1 Tax=Austropuccinia psidii MF-1 TaxID=1389203 RepID=A0A9Q3JH84_9BASI|nr:hypothetical protein [Austropuccinia psidii MF-1]